MPGQEEINRRVRDLILCGQEGDIQSELEDLVVSLAERDCRISEVLDSLLEEVEQLILICDQLDAEGIDLEDESFVE
ncbi:MAG: hypothetical protein A4E45_01003 [Methanosaeta sp. PtaB.Bin039]|nr:MAG: hypothetical protein A4E45_01003 [Methanosaeta sp. PtaB.Bin039]HOT07293.1 hypothetical protein [Methanotrichaceae archaeon]HQF15818.1 hypothetical protein [Methanotrichaceae archaeon]HQI90506.1 hypothetical protein [Methanotrichaceae archaeon]HQJ28105.1 hypothetical protein [Methanotrichaceae archaeon]